MSSILSKSIESEWLNFIDCGIFANSLSKGKFFKKPKQLLNVRIIQEDGAIGKGLSKGGIETFLL